MTRTITNLVLFLHLLVQAGAYTFAYNGGGTSIYDKMPVMTSEAYEPAHRSSALARHGGYGYSGYDGGFGMGRYNDYNNGYGMGRHNDHNNGYGMGRYNDYGMQRGYSG